MELIRLYQTFVVYSMIGWVLESIFHSVWEKKLVNRGFLNGPFVPVYGFGALLVLAVLQPFSQHWYIVFPVSILLTTTLEYFTGWAMEKLFHNRWWDYSMFPLNLHGRICFIFSLGWGFLCLLLVYVINPAVDRVVERPSQALSTTIAVIMFVVMLTDLIFTIRATVNLNETLMKLEKVRSMARVRGSEFTGGIQERMAVIAKSFIIWRKQVREIGYIQRRLLRAFPHMQSLRYQESFDRLRGWLNGRRPHFVMPVVKIPDLRKILESIELPPRPILKNPFANGTRKKKK